MPKVGMEKGWKKVVFYRFSCFFQDDSTLYKLIQEMLC